MYHYTESGLKNIYLRTGYDKLEINGEKAVSIHDLDGLHNVISQDIIDSPSALTGDEIRFLRKEMDLTQNSFADILSVSEDTVRGWENGRTDIPGPADKLIRVFYSQHSDCSNNLRYAGSNNLRYAVEQIARIDRDMAENARQMNFEENEEGHWQAAA